MTPTRVLVFPDSGPRIGGGHVMRCLTLAQALIQRGAACAFAATPATQAILQAFAAPDIEVFPVIDNIDQAPAAAVTWAATFRADWVLIDHYGLTCTQEAELGEGRRLAVIDDLADRPRPADLVVNPGFGWTAGRYAGLVPPEAALLTGPAYALVRPEFAHRRDAALARRREGGHLRHILISLGLTDVEGVTARVVAAVRPLLQDLILDVVLGGAAPSLPALCAAAKTDPALRLHIDSHAMAELTGAADLAIGAGGSSVWERAVLGLPAVTIILADNQRPMAQAMAAAGLCLAVDATNPDFEARLAEALHTLIHDAARRRSISEASAAICDGLGAGRMAEAMLG
jgi:UDP-2,4-diacetamido-2,4,6-trideoxy-beta-L-altropyranose hydrolase